MKINIFDTYRQHFGRGLLRPALAERVAGLQGAIIGSNVSPGAAFFHDGESHAHMIHRHLSYAPGRLPADPVSAAPGIEGDTAVTQRFIDMLLERRPATATLWLSEPDVSMHAAPLGSPLHLTALKQADALVGKVIEAVGRLRDAGHDVLLMVGSDHGHESISEVIPVERRLFKAGFKSDAEANLQLQQATVITTDWGTWRRTYPDTTVLVAELALGRDFDFRKGRDANGPIFPVGDVDPRLPVHEDVIGAIAASGKPVAFQRSAAMIALRRGETISFENIRLVLSAGGIRAIDADGSDLGSHQAFWFAWSQFHPGTVLWPR